MRPVQRFLSIIFIFKMSLQNKMCLIHWRYRFFKQMCKLVKISWSKMKKQTIIKSLFKCDISDAFHESEDNFLYEWRKCDNISKEDLDDRDMHFSGFYKTVYDSKATEVFCHKYFYIKIRYSFTLHFL